MKCPYCEATIDHVIIEFLDSSKFKLKDGKPIRFQHGRAYLCPNCDKVLPIHQ